MFKCMIKKYLILVAVVVFLFAGAGQAYALGGTQTLSQTICVGKTLSVGLYNSGTGSWYITGNTNRLVADVSLSYENYPAVIVKGLTAGMTQIQVCAEPTGINCLVLNVTVTGNVLGASVTNAHPAGSWLISNKTVFYVSSEGLIPVSTWKIFLSNGGSSKLIQPMNADDERLPLLGLMAKKDSRVQ